MVGEVDGPNIRGNVAESIKEEMASQGSEPADPLVHEQLPRARREHTEEYFNRLIETASSSGSCHNRRTTRL